MKSKSPKKTTDESRLIYETTIKIIVGVLVVLLATSAKAQTKKPGFSGYLLDDSNLSSRGSDDEIAAWSEQFETPGVSWRYLFRENNVEILEHRRSDESFHSGSLSEKIVFNFPKAGYAFLGHYIDYPILNNEIQPSLWIRADRPGITIGMLVVLPKTVRPDSGTPLTFLLHGSTYSRVGDWEKLQFSKNIKKEFNEAIQSFRGEYGIVVDPDEAYLRQIVLLVEGRRGKLSVWIDDLEFCRHESRPWDSLLSDERKTSFNPINILGFRLAVTGESVFLGVDQNNPYLFGKEPFAIDEEKVEERKKWLERRDRLVRQNLLLQQWNDENNARFRFDPNIPFMKNEADFLNVGSADFSTVAELGNEQRSIAPVLYSSQSPEEAESESPIVAGSGTLPTEDGSPVQSFPVVRQKPIPEPKFKEKVLTLDQQEAFGVRAVEYQGESFQFLKNLHFNAVWLKSPPTAAQLQEADQAGLWLIAPPPIGQETVVSEETEGSPVAETAEDVPPYFNRVPVASVYDRVLAWDVGNDFQREDLEKVRRRVSLIRNLDERKRPVVAQLNSGVQEFTYQYDVDAILMRRSPILTSLDLNDYGRWLKNYQNLGTPSSPYWNKIQTQPDPRLLAQSRFFGAFEESPALVSYEQIRQQVRMSIAANCHGLLFASETPLDQTDRETQYRATALELMNLELALINWWFANGTNEDLIETNRSSLSAAVMRTQRAVLVMPLSTESDNQYCMGQAAENDVKWIAPAQEGYTAELLVPGILRKIPSQRLAGGIHLNLESAGMDSLVFLTQSDLYRREIAEKAPTLGPRMAELAIRLAKMRLDLFQQTFYQLKYLRDRGGIPILTSTNRPLIEIREQETMLSQTRTAIRLAEDYLRQKDDSQAYLQAELALRDIRSVEREFWRTATRFEENRPVLPVSVSFYMLPAYLENYQRISGKIVRLTGTNKIQGGDMEDSVAWNDGKWNAFQKPIAATESELVRDSESARTGNFGLRLSNKSTLEKTPDEMEYAPIGVTIPCAVKTGEMVCVQGWIKIPSEIQGSCDGLTIFEDHGGSALALRFKTTKNNEWQQFAFYRYAAFDGEMKVRIELSGYGQVFIDDVGVYTVQ